MNKQKARRMLCLKEKQRTSHLECLPPPFRVAVELSSGAARRCCYFGVAGVPDTRRAKSVGGCECSAPLSAEDQTSLASTFSGASVFVEGLWPVFPLAICMSNTRILWHQRHERMRSSAVLQINAWLVPDTLVLVYVSVSPSRLGPLPPNFLVTSSSRVTLHRRRARVHRVYRVH